MFRQKFCIMCMETKFTEPRKTESECVCWKILLVNNHGFVFTPFMLKRVRPVHLSGNVPFFAVGPVDLSYRHKILTVGGGFIHSYSDKNTAEKHLESYNFISKFDATRKKIGPCHAEVFECRIPEDTRYYMNEKGEIASSCVVFLPKEEESKTERKRKLLEAAINL